MKSLLIKIGAIIGLTGVILLTLTFTYHERVFCLMKNTKTSENTQVLYLVDEARNKEFEITWTYEGKLPRYKVANDHTYYLCNHYSFIQDNYSLVFSE